MKIINCRSESAEPSSIYNKRKNMRVIGIFSVIIALFIISTPALAGVFDYRNTILNHSFEEGLSDDGTHPRWWRVGFPDDVPIDALGEWQLDSLVAATGSFSLKLIPDCDSLENYFLTQFIDAPTFDLEGQTVTFSVKIRCYAPGGITAVLLAFNPLSPDSFLGVPAVSGLIIGPEYADTGFVEFSDSFVATGSAAAMAVILFVDGWCDGAWFDDIRVELDVAEAGPGPDTSDVPDPLGGATRNFYVGAVADIPRNYSEAAFDALPSEIAVIGDMVNIFAHIKWNGLTGEPLLSGHEQRIEWASSADALGLAKMLSLDFTHDSALSLGGINPMPDGTPVDSLSPEVRAAFIDELVALVEEIEPIVVSVGIEMNFFFDVRPGQWSNYILLLQEARTALSGYPDIHVTTYFVLTEMIDFDGSFFPTMRTAWEWIMPYCESVAYSFYAPYPGTTAYADSYFTVVKALAPDKPLLIPEFGCRSDTSQGFSEEAQFNMMRKIVCDLTTTTPPPVGVFWYQMFDTEYLDASLWFRTAFATIGMHDFAGTPKMVHVAFRKLLDNTGIAESPTAKPAAFTLSAYPNPFNSAVTISIYQAGTPVLPVSQTSTPEIEIFDINGRKIEEIPLNPPLTRGTSFSPRLLKGGRGGFVWQPDENLGSGVYLIRAKIGDEQTVMKRVVYLK